MWRSMKMSSPVTIDPNEETETIVLPPLLQVLLGMEILWVVSVDSLLFVVEDLHGVQPSKPLALLGRESLLPQ